MGPRGIRGLPGIALEARPLVTGHYMPKFILLLRYFITTALLRIFMGNINKIKHRQPNHISTLWEEPLGTDDPSGPKQFIPHSMTIIMTEQLNSYIELVRVQSIYYNKKLRSDENHNPNRDRVSYIDLKPKHDNHLSPTDMCGQCDSNGTSQHLQYDHNMITKQPHSQYWPMTRNHSNDYQCPGLRSETGKYKTKEEWGSSRGKDSGIRSDGCGLYTASSLLRRHESNHHCTPLLLIT